MNVIKAFFFTYVSHSTNIVKCDVPKIAKSSLVMPFTKACGTSYRFDAGDKLFPIS